MPAAAVGIAYLDGPRLQRSLLAAADWVEAGRDELNRINVFPVPDGDTGTNVALTLRAVATAVRTLPPSPLPVVARTMAEAGMLGARGNSGMLLSQFLVGFREALPEQAAVTPAEVARALRAGAAQLAAALDEPVEGTILTVCREAAAAAEGAAGTPGGLSDLMRETLERSEAALQRTPELLPVLKQAGVVDAGAKAFVRLIEGIVRLIDGQPTAGVAPRGDAALPAAAALASVAPERDFRFCTEALVRGARLPEPSQVRSRLRELGGSIVLAPAATLLKIHIHTDDPEQVFSVAREWGALESTKAEDMREQHRRLDAPSRRVAVVVDSSCDLPNELVEKHGITVVPIQVMDGDRAYLDRVDITGAEIYRRMRDERATFTTSQPAPGALATAFRGALARAEEVVALVLSSTFSGTFASACAVARAEEFRRVAVVDSRTVTLGLGLQALRAAELAASGQSGAQITRDLERLRTSSGGFFTVERLEYLLRSGRVGRARAWLGDLFDLKPILEVDTAGGVRPLDRVRGSDALIPRVLAHLAGRLAGARGPVRLGIVHAEATGRAEELRDRLVARYRPAICLIADATAAIGVHVGPGAWGVFYQVEAD